MATVLDDNVAVVVQTVRAVDFAGNFAFGLGNANVGRGVDVHLTVRAMVFGATYARGKW